MFALIFSFPLFAQDGASSQPPGPIADPTDPTDPLGRRDEVFAVDLSHVQRESQIGAEIEARFEGELAKLRTLEEEIDTELKAEEERLTSLRGEIDVEEFLPLAESFDQNSNHQRRRVNGLYLDLTHRRAVHSERFRELLLDLAQQLVDRGGGALLLDSGRGAVIAVRAENDITRNLLEFVDEQYRDNKAELDGIIFADVPPRPSESELPRGEPETRLRNISKRNTALENNTEGVLREETNASINQGESEQ